MNERRAESLSTLRSLSWPKGKADPWANNPANNIAKVVIRASDFSKFSTKVDYLCLQI